MKKHADTFSHSGRLIALSERLQNIGLTSFDSDRALELGLTPEELAFCHSMHQDPKAMAAHKSEQLALQPMGAEHGIAVTFTENR